MSAVIRALLIVLLASASAFADGETRVVLADKDPELLRAIRATLAPWRLQVVVDEGDVHVLTTQDGARFVVWRENGELVVFDRERKQAERREAPAGSLDPVSAAAAALTVKTLMRLPPPADETSPPTETPAITETPLPITRTPPTALGVQVGGGGRLAGGALGGVASIAVFVKPPLPLRLGVAGEYASAVDAEGGSGFKGTWHDWNVLGLAGWGIPLSARWELEPHIGMGVRRFVLDGRENMMTERHERETLFMLRAGVFARARFGQFCVGATGAIDGSLGTPTYTRMGMGSEVFAVPPFALSVAMFVGAEL